MEINNLTKLMEIDENLVVNILKKRYSEDVIYTNIDDILIAINPYKNLQIYNDYKTFSTPHIYNIAQKSIDNLTNHIKNQTILVSGDSGAGKTFSVKSIINYFAHHFSSDEYLCNQIINANPIIEMFGNAQTAMNDNSSRFGKFIKIYFNNQVNHITGIQIDTYLLEKSRVCYQNNNDFNFHIFNQLAIHNKKTYNYCKNPIQNQSLQTTIDMMLHFGFDITEINDLIKILNLILEIGEFKENDVKKWEEYIDLDNFNDLISTRTLKFGHDIITKKLVDDDLEKNKFSIATQLYQICFNFVIDKINHILNPNNTDYKFIGLLDIFGFEIFEYNNFEQLCINYTNEKLQNYHNFIIFQNEQELYKKEGINWKIVDYKDNTNIINIFDNKYGLIDLLDEECTLVKSTDKNLHLKMTNRIKSEHFNIDLYPNFKVHHYAGNVEYSCNNFCYKNKQKITQEFISFISKSKNSILKSSINKPTKIHSIIKSFSKELNILMNKIKETNSMFIKCIKPNNLQIKNQYNSELIHIQLLFSGVFEIIEISRSNYPIRYPILEFYNKYNFIMNEFNMQKFNQKDIQFGKTIVFMKTTTFTYLEKTLLDYKNKCAVIIQKNWKRFYIQRFYKKLKISTIKIQSTIRMFIQKRRYQKIKQNIIKIQSYLRMQKYRKEYIKKYKSIIKIQSLCRMYLMRKHYLKLKESTIKIQSTWRMYQTKKLFINLKTKVLCFQRLWRQKKNNNNNKFIFNIPSNFWPKSDFDSPSAFYITNNDLIIEDDDDILTPPKTEEEEKEIETIKEQYENKIKTLEKECDKYKMKKQQIKEKFQKKLIQSEQNNKILSESLITTQETNKILTERLNNLLIANHHLRHKFEKEKKKNFINKIYEFLFT